MKNRSFFEKKEPKKLLNLSTWSNLKVFVALFSKSAGLRFLPLHGLAVGLILWGIAHFAWILGHLWLAILLLLVSLLGNGGRWLRGVLLLRPGQAAPFLGGLYFVLHYLCFVVLLRQGASWAVYVAAAVSGRWLYLWGMYDFAALAPAALRRDLSRRDFALASAASLALVAICAARHPALWPALVTALLFAWLFYGERRRFLGALDEAAYGVAAAWGEVILYLAYLAFGVWL